MSGQMNPKFPIYIVSKGRWKTRLTSKALDSMGLDYKIIIESQEFEKYAKEVGASKILVLPKEYFKGL